jgi:hypothetical protein
MHTQREHAEFLVSDEVGPLSGKTIMAVIVWLLSWAILHAVYHN